MRTSILQALGAVQRSRTRIVRISALFLFLAATSCDVSTPGPAPSLAVAGVPPKLVSDSSGAYFVRGIETPTILASLRGSIVRVYPVGGVERIELPSLSSTMLRPAGASNSGVPCSFSVGGPDAHGNVVYVHDDIVKEEHALVLLEAGTARERVLFRGKGSVLLDDLLGDCLALTSAGDRVAYVRNPRPATNPGAGHLLKEGTIEFCAIATGARTSTSITALDGRLSWSQDGARLIYACLLDRVQALRLAGLHFQSDRAFRAGYDGWSRLPVVCSLDVATNAVEALCIGEHPVLSPDGTKLIVRDTLILMRMLRLDTNTWAPFELVGMTFPGVVGFVDDDTVLYQAWPTEGVAPAWLGGSPIARTKQGRTLQVRQLVSDAYATVVHDFDPRDSFALGPR